MYLYYFKLFICVDTAEKLTNDYEIQNWANSLVAEEGLGLKVRVLKMAAIPNIPNSNRSAWLHFTRSFKGVPGNGEFKRNKHLTKVLTSIIFMGSVSHAAANFSQYDDYAFPANYPAFLRGNPPEDKV